MTRSEAASTFSKGLQVLACFEARQRGFTMAEIARLTGFDRATTRRLCFSLIETGYLCKVNQTLCLTPKILATAGGYLEANDIGLSVQPILDQYANELGCEISLAVRDGGRAIYVAKSKIGTTRLSMGLTVGSTLPLTNTAVGRAILSMCNAETKGDVLQNMLTEPYTPKTVRDPIKIRTEIAKSADQGFAYVAEEFELGAAAIAVPVGMLTGSEAVVGMTNAVGKLKADKDRDAALSILHQTAMSLRRLSIFA